MNRSDSIEEMPTKPNYKFGGLDFSPKPDPNQKPVEPELEHYADLGRMPIPFTTTVTEQIVQGAVGREVKQSPTPDYVEADFAFALFDVAKKNGAEKLKAVADELNTSAIPYVEQADVVGAFVNVQLNKGDIARQTVLDIEKAPQDYGKINIGGGANIVIDTSSPNIAKNMNVAHLRSTVIGESLGRIYQACGYTVIRDNHLGDWGTQFGLLGHAYKLWGHEIPDLKPGGNTIKGLLELYIRINQEVAAEKTAFEEQNQDNPDAEEAVSELEEQGRIWFQKLEEGDPEAHKLWEWAYEISMVEANKIYEQLGSQFEYILGESYYVKYADALIEALIKAGIVTTDEKGRVVAQFSKDKKMPDLTVRKSDGTTLYSTRDLATLAARTVWFNPAKILYVVGGEQENYFRQVFETFSSFSKTAKLAPPVMEHVKFGLVKLPEGKMSTRKGNIIFLQDVLDEAVKRAKVNVQENLDEGQSHLSPDQADEVASMIGVGAVIYSELRQPRTRTIVFSWDEMLSFTGNSGPYLQYTNARINALLRKAKETDVKIDDSAELAFESNIEKELGFELAKFPMAIKEAQEKDEPAILAEYVYRLSNTFNKFYKQEVILSAPQKQRNFRLRLARATSYTLCNGLGLLGIPTPEAM